jgi:phosphoglucosamine mutase
MTNIPKLFGTDGIRSVANQWPLTSDFVVRVGQAIGQIIAHESDKPMVVIGRDTRLSGEMLESALASGLMSQGVDTLHLGVITTPGIAYLTTKLGARLGIVISASHNPYEDNGIKVFGPNGFKIPDEMEVEIERLAQSEAGGNPPPHHSSLGRRIEGQSHQQDYLAYLVRSAGDPDLLQGMRIVVDCASGATSELAPELFTRLGAKVTAMNNEPDGLNINNSYEYLEPQSVRQALLREGADVGVAFDGDGDRVILVDEKGNFVDGDCLMAILAREMQAQGTLRQDTVIGTVMSNVGLELSLREIDVRLERTPVGDRYVSQRMVEGGFTLGGEQAGHIIIFGYDHAAGDGLFTALRVLKTMVAHRPQPLSELASCFHKYPQVLINVPVSRKPPLEEIPEVQAQVAKAEAVLGEAGRIVLRYSGTENLARVMIEGDDQEVIEREAQAIADIIQRVIGQIQVKAALPRYRRT